MAKKPRVPIENQIITLSVVKIAIHFSPCIQPLNFTPYSNFTLSHVMTKSQFLCYEIWMKTRIYRCRKFRQKRNWQDTSIQHLARFSNNYNTILRNNVFHSSNFSVFLINLVTTPIIVNWFSWTWNVFFFLISDNGTISLGNMLLLLWQFIVHHERSRSGTISNFAKAIGMHVRCFKRRFKRLSGFVQKGLVKLWLRCCSIKKRKLQCRVRKVQGMRSRSSKAHQFYKDGRGRVYVCYT